MISRAAPRAALSAHLASLTAVSPAWLALGPAGTISYQDSDAFAQGLTARGAALLPVLRDPARRISSVLAYTSTRKEAARRLAVMLRALGAQGIVLDLGPVPARDRRALPSLLRDLRDLSRPATLVLRAWGGVHATTGPHPIASLGWYKRTLRYTLAHAPRSKVIVALPTFGAVWTETGVVRRTQAELSPLARPLALAQAAGARVVQHGTIGWVESDRSLQLKLEVARAAHVAGVALWVRGGKSAGVWREPLIAPATR